MTNPPLRKQTLSTWTTISTIREIILLGPVCGGEIGSKSTERHEITEMHVFFFPSLPLPPQPCICKLPLCLLHWICARRFHPPLRLTAAHEAGLFFFSIPSPCSPSSLCSLCPSEFPGDFISAISNRIGAQFSMLHVTLPPNIRT